jgi:hypothetical protein
LRDRLMRYGSLDAATAWHVIGFVRGDQPLDWGRVLAAAGLSDRR